MKIGIIGAGVVGTTLAAGWAACGHDVLVGTRRPGEREAPASAVRVGTFADAARHGDVALIAAKWSAIDTVIASAEPESFAGKVVMDASNPLTYAEGRPTGIVMPSSGSAGEYIASLLPQARVVKAFNMVGAPLMVRPQLPDGPPDMLICGDDAEAKAIVAGLCADVVYPAYDVGPLARSAQIEQLAWLWITIAMQGTTGGHAFRLLRRNS